MRDKVRHIATATILTCAAAGAYGDDELAVHHMDGVKFTTGGVGDTEQRLIDEMGDAFNLHVVTALQEGNYLARIPIDISDQSGRDVISTVTDGPYLLVDLEPGTYTVTATYEMDSRQQVAEVQAGDGPQRLTFAW